MPVTGETLVVNEIYASIQGESTFAGRPCVFVRLTGCNLRCRWCDTAYAFYEGTRRSVDDVTDEVTGYGLPLVEITGGEPLLQEACATLARRLLDGGKTVLVETSGAQPIDMLPPGTIRIMDIKCPGSGESDQMDWRNLTSLTPRDEVKFVVADHADYVWACATILRFDLTQRCTVLFSAVHGELSDRELAEWILADKLDARLQLPLHKHIWEPGTRSV